MTHTLQTSTIVPSPVSSVFAFFSDAANLQRITPPELRFRILTPEPIKMGEGTRIEYRMQLFGIPFRWSTLITLWEPPYGFVDVQTRGPYRRWAHTHRFTEEEEGTRMADEVVYQLPFWPLGEIAYPLVKRELSRIFFFRGEKIRQIFGRGDFCIDPER